MSTNPDNDLPGERIPSEGALRYRRGSSGRRVLQRWEWSATERNWGWYDVPRAFEELGDKK